MWQRIAFSWLFCILPACFGQAGGLFAQYVLDASFADQGHLHLGPDTVTTFVDALVLPGDSLLLIGQTGPVSATELDRDIYLVKTDRDGQPDLAFGQSGALRFDFAGLDYCTASALIEDPLDGSFLLVGSGRSDTNTTKTWGCLQRISRSGQLLPLDANHSDLRFEFFGQAEYPNVILRDQAGRYLIAGSSFDPLGNHPQPVLMRVTSDFEPDSSFGVTGKLLFDFGAFEHLRGSAVHFSGGFIRDMVLLPDTGVAICGGISNGDRYLGFVAKATAQGTVDVAFGPSSGYISMDLFGSYDTKITSLLSLGDGTFAFGGSTGGGNPDHELLVGRVNPSNGSFAYELVRYGDGGDEVEDMALTPEGGLLVAATSEIAGNSVYSLCHFPDPNRLEDRSIQNFSPDPVYAATNTFLAVQGDRMLLGGYQRTASLQVRGLLTGVSLAATPAPEPTEEAYALSLYPNPAQDHLFLRSESAIRTVRLLDLQGRVLLDRSFPGLKEVELSLAGLARGTYLVQLNAGMVKRVVVE